ncbi:unnamed protein product [Clonostachys byssicola]|uniref:F-box domain-containing protein n=1 Tax=Clonostachys byssicola TaxID=160290 RepID=A0A9N9Y1K3_9HYPO|nr:unnamed protein product [Clonostachys byssicola]
MEGLASELVENIYQFLEPSWHYNLARTCRSLYQSSAHILRLHAAAYENGRIASDREPSDILKLLNSVSHPTGAEAIEAWHVREYEVWGSRESWREWQQWRVDPDGSILMETVDNPAIEADRIKSLANSFLREFTFTTETDHDMARNEIETGGDGFVKMLIISGLPRLTALRFVEKERDLHTSLEWMWKAVSNSVAASIPWPIGFISLRSVAVGVVTRNPTDSNMADSRAKHLAMLLRLPNIEEVYFRNLNMRTDGDIEDVDDAQERFQLPAACSSVKRIILDRIRDDSWSFREALLMAPSALEALVIRGHPENADEPMDSDMIPVCLADSSSCQSLRRFTIYRPDYVNSHHSRLYEPGLLQGLHNLGLVSLCIQDIILEALGEARNQQSDEGGIDESEYIQEMGIDDVSLPHCTNDDFINHDELVAAFVWLLPASLEVLVLWGQETDEYGEWFRRGEYEEYETIDDAIVAMMRSGRFKKLKAVYLNPIEENGSTPREKVLFQKAIEEGRNRGVQIHTVANHPEEDHMLEFVPIPDKYDMITGSMGDWDESWVVHPFTGEWTSPGCLGCGECEICSRHYTRSAWENFHNLCG